jgi:dTDP-4-dehydrorhamnose 3,5-epimerase
MGAVSLGDITVTPLERIAAAGGAVLHAMKRGDAGFAGFGEAYFSLLERGVVKAWRRHERMTLNLVVPIGSVRFVFHRREQPNDFRIEHAGEDRYVRLTVPPGIWFGFRGLADPRSLVLNLADLPHDPAEMHRVPASDIPFTW